MKKILLYLFIIISIFINTGCWNYKDIDDMRFISAMAVDYDEAKDEFILTVEVYNSSKLKAELQGEIFIARGDSLFDAARDLVLKNARKVYWAHLEVLIISKEVAENHIIPILDYIHRDGEFRAIIYMLVSDEKTAGEILEYDKHSLYKLLADHIEHTLKSEESISRYHTVPFWQFIKTLYVEGVSPTIPVIRNVHIVGRRITQIKGTAVFNIDKYVGQLDEYDTKSYMIVIDKLKGGILDTEVKIDNREETTKVAFEVFDSKTNIKPRYENSNIILDLEVKSEVNIGEIEGAENIINKTNLEELKHSADRAIEKRVQNVIKKVQREYSADIFGFATIIKTDNPDLWRQIGKDWEQEFKQIKINVKSDITIRGTGLASGTIDVKE